MSFSLLPTFYGSSWIYLIFVGLFWGATNPFIKKGAHGIEKIKATNSFFQIFYELKFLFTNLKYVIPFLINQLGSILYFLALQNTDISLAVPISNTMTFLFTAAIGQLFGETKPNKKTMLGISMIVAGISLCVWDNVSRNKAVI